MSQDLFTSKSPKKGRRIWSFAGSVALHTAGLGLLSIWRELDNAGLLRTHEETLEKQLATAKKTMLYFPRPRLPNVSPVKSAKLTREANPAADNPNTIRTQPPRKTLNNDQFIRVPVPQVKVQPPVPSPNIVVVQQTLVAPPPPPPAPKAAPKTFVPPTAVKPKATATKEGLVAAMEDAPKQPTILTPGGAPPSAPSIPTSRRFTPPPPSAATGKGRTPSDSLATSDAAPTLNGQQPVTGNSGLATTIIISANPTPGAPPPKPEGNRNARISVPGGETGPASTASSGGITAPGVVIRSGTPAPMHPGAVGPPPGGPPSTAAAGIAGRVPPVNTSTGVSAPLRPKVRQVPPQVEEMFAGRTVYSTSVATVAGQPDWILWFGDPAGAHPPFERVVMRPPAPEKGTLPAALPGMPVKTWISAKLRRNGILTELAGPKGGGVSPQLLQELGKWTFQPAVRNSQPAEVDVLIEVTWRP